MNCKNCTVCQQKCSGTLTIVRLTPLWEARIAFDGLCAPLALRALRTGLTPESVPNEQTCNAKRRTVNKTNEQTKRKTTNTEPRARVHLKIAYGRSGRNKKGILSGFSRLDTARIHRDFICENGTLYNVQFRSEKNIFVGSVMVVMNVQ